MSVMCVDSSGYLTVTELRTLNKTLPDELFQAMERKCQTDNLIGLDEFVLYWETAAGEQCCTH